jgi:hypothetical protein
MSTFAQAVAKGKTFRHAETTKEFRETVVRSLLAGEDTAGLYAEVRWARGLDQSEVRELEDRAAVGSEALLETLVVLAGLEEDQFDEEDCFAWKLGEALLEREALEGVAVLFLRAGRKLERLQRELDLLDSSVGEEHREHFRMLLVPYLEEDRETPRLATAEALLEVFLLDHTAWWGQPDEESRMAFARMALEEEVSGEGD